MAVALLPAILESEKRCPLLLPEDVLEAVVEAVQDLRLPK